MLAALLILAAIVSTLWVIAIPPWRTPDEFHHFGYIQYLARERSIPVSGRAYLYRDLLESYQSTNFRAIFGKDTTEVNLEVPEVNNAAGHPPLYYSLALPAYAAASGGSMETQLYAVRIFSCLLFVLLIAASYRMAQAVFPRAVYLQIGVPLLLIFHPQFVFISASANNDLLLALLFTWFLYNLVIFCQGDFRYRRAAMIGLAVGLGMLTKSSFVIAYIVGGGVFAALLALKRGKRAFMIKAAAAAMGVSLLICGWFYVRNFFELGALQPYSRTDTYKTDSALVLWTRTSFRNNFIASFIGNFSWLSIPLPGKALYWFRRIAELSAIGLSVSLVLGLFRKNWQVIKPWLAGLFVLTLFLFTLSATFFELRVGGAQGRYLFPAIFPFWSLVLIGLVGWLPPAWRPRTAALVVSIFVLFGIWSLMIEFIPRVM